MASLLTPRKKVPPTPVQPWAERRPAELKDRDGWPIRKTARVACRRGGHLWSGRVMDAYLDHKDREVVEVRTPSGVRLFRPHECRVQRG